jgi:prepilin-type N-terminal cleavage/methylation domain-containing protein
MQFYGGRNQMNKPTQRGFSMLELMFVVAIMAVIAAFAIPGYLTMRKSYRIAGDSRVLAGLVAEAKLRAAANFTHARVYANLNANTYRLEVWNKTSGCWQTDGDSNPCTVAGVSPIQYLSASVTFGVGNVSSAPANTEPALAQSPLCYMGYAGQTGNTVTIANTACIEFNSRGVPSDPATNGAPDATGAFYVTDGASVYGNTLLASGLIQNWYATNTSTATWQQL